MKYFLLFASIFLTLCSCSVYNRIGELNDASKEIKRLTLKQNPQASSSETMDANSGLKQSYSFISGFEYEQVANERPEIFADFQLRVSVPTEQPDSVLYFSLDGEKIKLVADESGWKNGKNNSTAASGGSKSGEKNTLKVTRESLHFLVPENLWVSIANAKRIQYQLNIGKKGVDVILNPAETDRLKQFFRQACALRDAAFPAIPTNPPGLKKW